MGGSEIAPPLKTLIWGTLTESISPASNSNLEVSFLFFFFSFPLFFFSSSFLVSSHVLGASAVFGHQLL